MAEKKNSRRLCLYLFLLVALGFALGFMAHTVRADIGPKPSIDIYMKNPPQQLYYLDLLGPPEFQGNYVWLEQYPDTEQQYNAQMLEVLKNYELDGWRPLVAAGSAGRLSGDWEGYPHGENGERKHTFTYHAVPDTFRIIVVTEDLQVVVSDVITRDGMEIQVDFDYATAQYKSSVIMTYEQASALDEQAAFLDDQGRSAAQTRPQWQSVLLLFVSTFVPTLLIEGIVLLLFRFPLKGNWKWLLLVNLATQVLLHVGLYAVDAAFPRAVLWLTLAFEVAIVAIEALAYRFLLRPHSPKRRVLYALAANVASFGLGELAWFLLR